MWWALLLSFADKGRNRLGVVMSLTQGHPKQSQVNAEAVCLRPKLLTHPSIDTLASGYFYILWTRQQRNMPWGTQDQCLARAWEFSSHTNNIRSTSGKKNFLEGIPALGFWATSSHSVNGCPGRELRFWTAAQQNVVVSTKETLDSGLQKFSHSLHPS